MACRATPVDLSGRRIVVTGAAPGSLGAATAAGLSDWGADVVITTRSDSDAAAAAIGAGVTGHPLELTDVASVQRFARWCEEWCGGDGLDVLVNNAGIHLDLRSRWSAPQLTPDGHEIHWRTNYLGTMQLTRLLLPVLGRAGRRTADARVVTVVSALHERGRNEFLFAPLTPYNSWNAYGLSKLALVHSMSQLSLRSRDDGIKGYAVHPGSVFTNIADRGLAGHRVLGAARRVLAPVERRMLRTPDEGAQTSVSCATAPDLAPGYYRDCAPAEPSAAAGDTSVAERLWAEFPL